MPVIWRKIMANNDEKVQLIIDAKNLSSEELNKAASDIENLGYHARDTEKQLKQLKIDSATLSSYEQMTNEVKQLQDSIRKAELDYEDLNTALKKNKNATREQREEVKKAKQNLSDQKKTLTSVSAEYRKMGKAVKSIVADSETSADAQERLTQEMQETSNEVKRLNKVLDDKAEKLKENIAVEKKVIASSEKKAKAEKEAAKEAEAAAKSSERKAKAEAAAAVEQKRVTDSLKKYEVALDKLNKEKNEGTINTGKYIRQEEKLRKELKLTATQAKSTRLAVEADNKATSNKSKSTDLLTTATRRLAQAYTVLLAAQKATEAVSAGVQSYSELESAITKVEKTTGLAREQVVAMQKQLTEMAEETTPTATNELLKYAEVAGQLGAKGSEDILQLVSAADALEVSTNLAGDEAAKLLTRVLTLTGEGIPSIHNLSSAVVELGNNFAASEDEIVHMTKEIASGTRSINLGSAAAAAYGTALKELGQPAERSRTAIQRVGEAIKSASDKGGADLQRLIDITGLTADEIETNLGERPEEVIFSFLEGLDGIKSAGGSVSDTLREMGIASQEANSVIGVLSANTERLRYAIDLSNHAYEDQTKHLQEAAKAYADQESSIARLVNKFTTLKAKIGEAFSDETNEVIEKLGDLIKGNTDEIVEMMEVVSELGEGFVELGGVVADLESVLFPMLETTGSWLNLIKLAFNDLTLGFRTISLAINELGIVFTEMVGGTEEELNKLRATSASISEGITQDLEDIRRAEARLNNQSSASYEDLQDATVKYKDAIAALSEEKQKEIEQAARTGTYVSENNELYRQLTATIVRKSREISIAAQLEEQAAELSRQAIEKESKARQESFDASLKTRNSLITAIEKETQTQDELAVKQNLVNEGYKKGFISIQELISFTQQLTSENINSNNTMKESVAIQKLRIDTDKEQSRAVSSLRKSIVDQGKALEDVRVKLQSLTLLDEERLALQLKQKKLQDDLNNSEKQLVLTRELEAKTSFQLVDIQRQHNLELANLQAKYEIGAITAGEYASAKEDLAFKTQLLNSLLPSEAGNLDTVTDSTRKAIEAAKELQRIKSGLTDDTDDNTDSTDKNTESLKGNAEAGGASVALLKLYNDAMANLNQEYDYSNTSTEKLTQRTKELTNWLEKSLKARLSELNFIYDINREAAKRELSIIKETNRLREWQAQVESGTLSLARLNDISGLANRNIEFLGENQLEPLRQAIASAKAEMQSLNDEIEDTLDDIDDRLDGLLGKEEDIVKRKYQREMEELNELLDRARESNNDRMIAKVEEAIRKLRKAQQLEYKEEFGSGTTTQQTQTTTQTQKYEVEIKLPTGGTTTVEVSSQTDANALISALTLLGEINIDGVG